MVLVAVLLLPAPRRAVAWGPQGHRAIAEVAQARLNAKVRAAVQGLLGTGHRLADVALWADELRQAAQSHTGPLLHDPEAQQFNADFPKNADWHFVNLPLGSTAYQDTGPFSGPNDVVHAINRCIAVLESPAATPHFSKLQALRFLAHLVGDVHQPLHVGTGYYTIHGDQPTLVTDPTAALHKLNDRGGNQLCYRRGAHGCAGELHAFWDGELPTLVGSGSTVAKLVAVLKARAADAQWRHAHQADLDDPPGDHHAWAAHWASHSVAQARGVYQGIQLGTVVVKHHAIDSIATTLPDHYGDAQLDRATAQLVGAGVHLAHLLNRLQWK